MTIRHLFAPLALGALSWSCAWGQQYSISTLAGNGTPGFSGDSGSPASAQLNSPGGIALDSAGNLYIADSVNQRVRKISGGAITTVAGNGTAGYAGDKAAATSAQLRGPSGVAVDSSGNLYIADTSNHVIRMVSTGGTITTFAGTNTGGYGGDGGNATNALLEFPTSVAVDSSGNVYIADSGNNVIRKVSGGKIFTVVGGGATAQQLNDPDTILLDPNGNLYISQSDGLRIVKFATDGTVTLIAGSGNLGFSGDNGPAIDAVFNHPTGIALDSAGYLYICDTFNSRIRKVSPGGIITTIAGVGIPAYGGDGGAATNAVLYFPRGVAINAAGNVYISDTGNNVIRLLQPVTPAIANGGIVNAASFTAQVSPGALASLFGSNITGSGVDAIASLPLPASLGGVSVSVNGTAAPVLYVSSSQVNFQIPWETQPGSATVSLSTNGMVSNTVSVSVQATAPGLFVQGSHAIVQNSNFTLNSSSNPAKVGDTILAYLTGAGAVSPQPADGAPAGSSPLSTVTSPVTATIGSKTAQVSFAGLAPSFVGLWQVNVVVPLGLAQGDFPLTVTVGGQTSNSANVSVAP
jgi:uncharacterized protein (TIGR03437 family)